MFALPKRSNIDAVERDLADIFGCNDNLAASRGVPEDELEHLRQMVSVLPLLVWGVDHQGILHGC